MGIKLGTALDHAGVDSLNVLDASVDIPVITGTPQAQGDVFWWCPDVSPAATPIPTEGVCVVAGESGGNTHSLHSYDGPSSYWDRRPAGPAGLILGVLTVPPGATAVLVHTEEHGANAFGPGTYELRRPREYAGEWRLVAD